MKEGILVKRYAQAFVEYAQDSMGIEAIVKEFKRLKIALSSNSDFEKFLFTPQIAFSEKYDTIDKALKEYFSEPFRIFLKFLIENGRIRYIADICDYVRVAYSHADTEEALLKTSYPLELKSIRDIRDKLEETLKKKIHFFIELDPELLGGVEVRVGNTLIDGSVRRRLDELKQQLMTVQVV